MFSHLETLNLEGCRAVSDSVLKAIAISNPILKSIKLQFAPVSDDMFAFIFQSLGAWNGLERISLKSCVRIGDATIANLCTFCLNLKEITVFGCQKLTIASVNAMSKRKFTLIDIRGSQIPNLPLPAPKPFSPPPPHRYNTWPYLTSSLTNIERSSLILRISLRNFNALRSLSLMILMRRRRTISLIR
ncbi:hypothetical protein BC829DRAFT_171818 [Chytridium lagenaria]|nr:hypothetical protein BC829DRAFT_171818 [Chytridium lagenaria]